MTCYNCSSQDLIPAKYPLTEEEKANKKKAFFGKQGYRCNSCGAWTFDRRTLDKASLL